MKTTSTTKAAAKLIFLLIFVSAAFAQNPYGTGLLKNVDLGSLADPSVVFSSNSGFGNNGFLPHPDSLLKDYRYELYIPAAYDSSEAYGIISWISSGSDGAIPPSWVSVLDERKLIWVGGLDIGNPVFVDKRMGVAWAAILRLKEVLHIDEDRIYTAGKSGGARVANTLAYIYPEWIDATLPLCGASFPLEVDQDYETHNPNSHYEVTLPFTASDLAYIKTFDQKYGIMTSFDDFREGDIMNIYHNGLEPNGMKGRFFETPGGHCATTREQFVDALNFVEHSFQAVIEDDFDQAASTIGNGYQAQAASLVGGSMDLLPDSSLAQVKTQDIFHWKDPKGSIIRTTLQVDSTSGNTENLRLHLGLWERGSHYCEWEGNAMPDSISGILVSFDFSGQQPTAEVHIRNDQDPGANSLFFSGEFADWKFSEEMRIKLHLWDKELRVEFSNHFSSSATAFRGAKLLDDERSVRIRWSDVQQNPAYWDTTQWSQGAFMTVVSDKINPANPVAPVQLDYLSVIAEEVELPISPPSVSAVENGPNIDADTGFVSYQWYWGGSPIAGQTGPSLLGIPGTGTYYVIVRDANGCTARSNDVQVVLSTIEGELSASSLRVYPNPFSTQVTVEGSREELQGLRVFDARGRELSQLIGIDHIRPTQLKLDFSVLPAGLYLIESFGSVNKVYKR